MRVKLVRRKITRRGYFVDVYDIYVGVPRILLPFLTRWFLDSKGLSEREASARIWNSFLSVKGTKLVTNVE